MKSSHADTAVKVSPIPSIFIVSMYTYFQNHSIRSKQYLLETASCKCKNARYLTFKNDAKEHERFSCYFKKENFKTNYHFDYNKN